MAKEQTFTDIHRKRVKNDKRNSVQWIDENLTKDIQRLHEKFPDIVDKVIARVAVRFKEEAKEKQENKFTQRTGDYNKSIKFVTYRGHGKARLFAGNLSNIYEKKGAEIKPKNKKVLRFVAPDGTVVFTRRPIHIPKKPWFRSAMRKAKAGGLGTEAAKEALNYIFEKEFMGLYKW